MDLYSARSDASRSVAYAKIRTIIYFIIEISIERFGRRTITDFYTNGLIILVPLLPELRPLLQELQLPLPQRLCLVLQRLFLAPHGRDLLL